MCGGEGQDEMQSERQIDQFCWTQDELFGRRGSIATWSAFLLPELAASSSNLNFPKFVSDGILMLWMLFSSALLAIGKVGHQWLNYVDLILLVLAR